MGRSISAHVILMTLSIVIPLCSVYLAVAAVCALFISLIQRQNKHRDKFKKRVRPAAESVPGQLTGSLSTSSYVVIACADEDKGLRVDSNSGAVVSRLVTFSM